MWFSNTSAFDTGLTPRPVRGVTAGLMLVDVFLRRHAGIREDALWLALFVTGGFAVDEVALFTFIADERSTVYLIVRKHSVWNIKRLRVTAVFHSQYFAGGCNRLARG